MLTHFSRQITFEHWNWRLAIRGGRRFLGLFMLRTREMAYPAPTKAGFSQSSPDMASCCTLRVHPPTSPCGPVLPFLLTQNLSPKDTLTLYQTMMHICIMFHLHDVLSSKSRRWLIEPRIGYNIHALYSTFSENAIEHMKMNVWISLLKLILYHCFLKWIVLMDSTIYKLTIQFCNNFLLCGVGWAGYCSFLWDPRFTTSLYIATAVGVEWLSTSSPVYLAAFGTDLSWQELAGELLRIWTEYKFLKFHQGYIACECYLQTC